MTLTWFKASSAWVAYALNGGNFVKMSFEGENQQEIDKRTEY